MKKLINQLGVGEVFNLNAIATVEELSNHDMIYIYHHIKKGSVLDLEFKEETLNGDFKYSVTFKGFVLGYLSISGILKSIYGERADIQAEVINYDKDPYMPFKHLDVQLSVKAMKKVG